MTIAASTLYPDRSAARCSTECGLVMAAALTRSSAIAEGLREALVSRNPATTKHLT